MTSDTGKRSEKNMFSALRGFLRTSQALRLLICIALIAAMILVFVAAIVPARYDLKVGQVPNVTIAATKDVVDEVTTEQKRVEAAAAVTPTYQYQEGVTESVMSLFDQVFSQLRAVRQYGETLPNRASNRIYSREELDYAGAMLTLITLRDYQLTTLLNTDQESLEELYASLYSAVKNTMSGHVTEGQESEAIQNVSMIVGFRTDTDLLQNVVLPVLKACIQPNMVIDQAATETARQEARKAVESVVYKQGQNIVVKGEGRVTVNQIKMLDTLGLLRSGAVDMTIYLGAALLVVLVMTTLFSLLKLTGEEVMANTRRLLLMSVTMLLTLGLAVCARLFNIYAAPILLSAMLLSATLSLRAGVFCNIAMALLVASLAAGGSETYTAQMVNLTTCSIISGTVAALLMSRSASRVRALLTGLVNAGLNFLVMLIFGLMTASSLAGTITDAFWCMGGGLAAGLLCIAFQPLLEVIFNLPTPMRLLELSNPNSPLLRRLMLEAPGTYHHSILVANLAEASAEAVGANPLLARVGAYYHDIGKLKRPLYFKENQVGDENAHDHTDPQVSAAILTAHARDGVALAKAYHLPYEVQRIIAEHHGSTPVMYFYHKALQLANGKPVDIDAFRYDGDRPSTKESAIIMMCDTIEAAVRSQKSTATPEEMEDYIVKLVRGKLADGQLNNAPLTLNDIDAICLASATVLKGVYHERIEYPDDMSTDKRHMLRRTKKQDTKLVNVAVKAPTPQKPQMIKPNPENHMAEHVEPQRVDERQLVVTPPPAPAPIAIDDLITLEPLTKIDMDEVETENAPGFHAPEDEPGADDEKTNAGQEEPNEDPDAPDENEEKE